MDEHKTTEEVALRPKSAWQKDDCINAQGLGCCGESTQEAVCGNAMIRCCTNPACVEYAKKLASLTGTR